MKIQEKDDCVVAHPAREPHSCVIWLHGLGADGYDFVSVAEQFAESGQPGSDGVRFVFPHAPKRPIAINNGMTMRGWYDIQDNDLSVSEDVNGIRASAKRLCRLLDEEREAGVPSARTAVAGFSQGGAMVLQVGLRYPHHLAGLLTLSSYLPLPHTIQEEALPGRVVAPITMMHGRYDTVIPVAQGRASLTALRYAGYSVTWQDYPISHSVCADEMNAIMYWLGIHLSPPSTLQ